MGGRGLIVPGRAYPHAASLLALARQALEEHGWSTVPVTWEPDVAGEAVDAGPVAATSFVERAVTSAAEEGADPTIVVGKSLGTRASAYAAQRAWPAVWLTPLLRDQGCVAGIRANPAPQLLVGGRGDDHWDAAVAAELGRTSAVVRVLELEDADHGLVASAGAVATAENVLLVARALDGWLVERAGEAA